MTILELALFVVLSIGPIIMAFAMSMFLLFVAAGPFQIVYIMPSAETDLETLARIEKRRNLQFLVVVILTLLALVPAKVAEYFGNDWVILIGAVTSLALLGLSWRLLLNSLSLSFVR